MVRLQSKAPTQNCFKRRGCTMGFGTSSRTIMIKVNRKQCWNRHMGVHKRAQHHPALMPNQAPVFLSWITEAEAGCQCEGVESGSVLSFQVIPQHAVISYTPRSRASIQINYRFFH
mmetsp:Transcript_7700/g.13642  ORF Transcript_7700/g.13642 Transcript_7700/m.13642 type:complete len:116 (-) Transcript_7700:1857-2204(-)